MDIYQKYYSNIENAKHHSNMEKLNNIESKGLFAIELGCGSGRDTIYLLKKRVYCFRNR